VGTEPRAVSEWQNQGLRGRTDWILRTSPSFTAIWASAESLAIGV
jgi:hypothetical protein